MKTIKEIQAALEAEEARLMKQLPKPPFRSIVVHPDSVLFGREYDYWTWEEVEKVYHWLGKVLGKSDENT
ncbi:hypothetical protein OAF54_00255 [bacterium]|nr:hypothetical protein [bacterium]